MRNKLLREKKTFISHRLKHITFFLSIVTIIGLSLTITFDHKNKLKKKHLKMSCFGLGTKIESSSYFDYIKWIRKKIIWKLGLLYWSDFYFSGLSFILILILINYVIAKHRQLFEFYNFYFLFSLINWFYFCSIIGLHLINVFRLWI